MIICNRCGNRDTFVEVHIGGHRRHEWIQEKSGRFVFDRSNYDKCDDVHFKCGKCNVDMDHEYGQFLRALFALYDEKKHGN